MCAISIGMPALGNAICLGSRRNKFAFSHAAIFCEAVFARALMNKEKRLPASNARFETGSEGSAHTMMHEWEA